MIRTIVVDDEPLARQGVLALLSRHADVQVVGVYADAESAAAGIAQLRPDLAFVDVRMPGMSGLELLGSLPRARRPQAIMLTAYEQHALEAFQVRALDYLLKPIDELRLDEALDRARDVLAREPAHDALKPIERLVIRLGNRQRIVQVAEIDWIEADGDYAVLHVAQASHLLRESLYRLARQLDPQRFVRIHRSTIVQVDRIVETEPLSNRDLLVRLADGTPLRASRTYVAQLERLLRR